MPLRTVQTNFTSGMLDAKVRDHIDLQAYRNGAKLIRNCRQLPQGGVTRRDGGLALALLEHDDYQVEPFIFSGSQAYVFLFRHHAVDIWNKITRLPVTTVEGPWTAAQIEAGEVRVTQQLDKMIVAHPDFETRIITRTGASTFSLSTFRWSRSSDGTVIHQPYHKYAASTVKMSLSATAVGPAVATTTNSFFESEHVGLKIRYRKKQMTVVSLIDATQANVTIDEVLPSMTADYDFDEQAFSALRGWARCFCLHQQRLWVGGGRDVPNQVWGSTIPDNFSMDLGTGEDDEAIKYGIYADRVAEIVSMVSNDFLQIFCKHGEFYVPEPDSKALTPATFSIKPQSKFGSANLQARVFDGSTIFITAKAQGLREFIFDALQTSFASDALTFMSKSLLSGPRDLDVQMEGEGEEQESRAYVSNEDGTIAVLSKVRKENISGWSYWNTEGLYRRLGVIDSEVWAVVSRTVNGTTGTYLEVFDSDCRLDFSALASGAAATEWGPFDLHKGQEVHMRSGDLYLGTATVDGDGMVETPIAVSELEIGLAYESEIQPLEQQVNQPDGITMGEPRRYVSLTAHLVDTIACRIKNRDLELDQDDPDVAPERYTGKFRAMLTGWGSAIDVSIKGSYPLPHTINALTIEVEV